MLVSKFYAAFRVMQAGVVTACNGSRNLKALFETRMAVAWFLGITRRPSTFPF